MFASADHMKITLDRFASQLRSELAGVYLFSGDEPLRLAECADAVRARAREAGFTARDVHFIERAGDWSAVRSGAANLSLFAERRVVEIRLPSGKAGVEGGRVLGEIIASRSADTLYLILTGRLDGQTQRAEWVQAADQQGVWVPIYDVDVAQLPDWIVARGKSLGLEIAADAAQLLAERVEGNLLAAHQELQQLQLLAGRERVDAAMVEGVVADSARFDVFKLGEAVLSGQAARALRILGGLRAEGIDATLALWSLRRELHNLWNTRNTDHRPSGAARPWVRQSAALDRARGRAHKTPFARLAARAARADRMIKGRMDGEPWMELALLAVEFCGVRALDPVVARR